LDAATGDAAAKVLVLSSIFSTDRILLYSSFMDVATPAFDPVVWGHGPNDPSFFDPQQHDRYFSPWPAAVRTRHWIDKLRHLASFSWDFAIGAPSRHSAWALTKRDTAAISERALHGVGRLIGRSKEPVWIDRTVGRIITRHGVSDALLRLLDQLEPRAVLALCPFQPEQIYTVAAAQRLGIPTIAYITSFDNITTKGRLAIDYDAYAVWSEQMAVELRRHYPASRDRSVHVIGSPQYDVFRQPRFESERGAFADEFGLDADRPIVVYCLGSPNIVQEDYGALRFCERATAHDPRLRDAQVIVRPHPGFREHGYSVLDEIRTRFPKVVVQGAHRHWTTAPYQNTTSIWEWVNTMRHADVVVNLASSVTIDASVFDRPVVNLDFDPSPGASRTRLVHDINHVWEHFKPLAESSGVQLADGESQLVDAVSSYLDDPAKDREGRAWMVERVCGRVDGHAGARLADLTASMVR